MCVCVFSGEPRPPPCFLSAVCLSHNECKGNLASWRRVGNLADICRALFLPGPSRQNNPILYPYDSVSCQGAELTPSDQTTTWNEGLCCSLRNMQPHTHECALCESVYTSCNRFIAIQDQQSVRSVTWRFCTSMAALLDPVL